MTADLVTRLRNPPYHARGCTKRGFGYECTCDFDGRLVTLMTEAADWIEAVGRRQAAALSEMHDIAEQLSRDRDRLIEALG